MTIEQALDVSMEDIAHMSHAQLKNYANTLFSASNKRLKRARADAHARTAPAIKNRRRFSSKLGYRKRIQEKPENARESKRTEKYYKRLTDEIYRARRFLRMKTSTIKGARALERKTIARFKGWGMNYSALSKANRNLFWETYSKYRESHLSQVFNVGSPEAQKAVFNAMFKLHITDAKALNKYVNSALKAALKEMNQETEPMSFDEWKKKGDVDL